MNGISMLVREEMTDDFHVKIDLYWHTSNYFSSLDVTYLCTKNEYNAKKAIWKKNEDKLLKGLVGNDSLTDVQKALLLHDRLIEICEYDYGSYIRGHIPDESFCAYGVMINNVAVCQGYAEVYKYLLAKVGIESYICDSDALRHAWNTVKIDGEYYFVDVTWDDQVWDISERASHEYFLLSTGEFIKTHTAYDYDTTPQDTKYDHYFWQNSNAVFQLVDGEIYYIDSNSESLNTYDGTVLASVDDGWTAGGCSVWVGNIARLCSNGQNLYYSLSDAVYKYNIKSKKTELIATPKQTFGENFSIYGMKYESGKLICEYYEKPSFLENTKELYSIVIDLEDDNAYSISGKIITYNGNDHATVRLVQGKETQYELVLDPTEKDGTLTQDFTLSDVLPGTYDLVVSKSGHLDYTVTGITVSDGDIDLTASEAPYAEMTLIAGDIDGNGLVNGNDVQIIRLATNINLKTAEASNALADVNGDGLINGNDVLIVRFSTNINKSKKDCTFEYIG